ncbi:hypothetical protein LX36DRAFT_656416 [Colletotrichum falcatum]|nr:hypothetical protein LX36DRAFT_656416 [Colletotrichum falcatum]
MSRCWYLSWRMGGWVPISSDGRVPVATGVKLWGRWGSVGRRLLQPRHFSVCIQLAAHSCLLSIETLVLLELLGKVQRTVFAVFCSYK